MNSKTKPILRVLNVVAWVVFVGLCVRTGALLFNFLFSLFINPGAAENLYGGLDLSELFKQDRFGYIWVFTLIILLSALKAYIFYWVIKIFLKINYVNPFSETIARYISIIGYIALFTGIGSLLTTAYVQWLGRKIAIPDLDHFIGAGFEHILFAGVIVFISQVFKRGIEIQSENELTV